MPLICIKFKLRCKYSKEQRFIQLKSSLNKGGGTNNRDRKCNGIFPGAACT